MAQLDIKGVKEQRVDGSSKSIHLDLVKFTLIAGKPVLYIKIHFGLITIKNYILIILFFFLFIFIPSFSTFISLKED